ncbi:MAG: hypothetical protein ACOCX4_10480 [Planctomycetota bacterium]
MRRTGCLCLLALAVSGGRGVAGSAESSSAPRTPVAADGARSAAEGPDAPGAPGAPAGRDESAVAALWNGFVAALRRGDMDAARGAYAPASRARMPADAFAAAHHPATAYGQLLLTRAGRVRIEVEENRAWIRQATDGAASAGGGEVALFAVREGGAWGLVTPARWSVADREARARALLREFRSLLQPVIARVGHARARELFVQAHADWFRSVRYRTVAAAYAIDWEATADAAWILRARPRRSASGLRAFTLDAEGVLRAGSAASAATSSMPPDAGAPAAPDAEE